MQLTYTCSLQDFIDAQRTHAWRRYSPAFARLQKVLEPIVGILLLCLAYMMYRWHYSASLVILEASLGFYVLLRERVIAPWIFRRAYRRKHVEPAQQGVMEFTPEHIHCASPGRSDVTIQWPMLRGYLDGPKTVLLYTAPGLFLYLPKWALNADQHRELLGLLALHQIPNTYPR